MDGVSENTAVTLVRKLRTTPRAVWKALTDAATLQRWLAPYEEFEALVMENDLCVGGRYRIVMKSPEGEERSVSGTYREVVPNEKLVYTWAENGAAEDESIVTFELTPAGDATELLLTHDRLADKATWGRYQAGWTRSIRRLTRMFA